LRIFAKLRLPFSVGLTERSSAASVPCMLGGLRGTLYAPRVSWGHGRPIVQPPRPRGFTKAALAQVRDDEDPWAWGTVASWREDSVGSAVWWAQSFIFRSMEENPTPDRLSYSEYLYGRGHPIGEAVDDLVDGWVNRLAEWLEVLSNQDANRVAPRRDVHVHGDGVQVWTVEDGVLSLPAAPHKISVTVSDDEPITHATWRRLLRLAGDHVPVPQSHRLLIDARAWARRNNPRRAVIDAGTAAELALTRLLEEQLEPLGEHVRRVIKREQRTLGRLVEVTSTLLPISREDLQHLVETRNGAVHRNEPVTDVRRAVATATAVANFVEPVSSLSVGHRGPTIGEK
jgi:hypothetical protein